MAHLIPNIDEILLNTNKLMTKMSNEFDTLHTSTSSDYEKKAAWIAFNLGLDYFKSATDSLSKNRLLSGGALVRTGFENVGDLFYMFRNPDKKMMYAKQYAESIEVFHLTMLKAALTDFDKVIDTRVLNQANKWTKASIQDRLSSGSKSMLLMYDILSYYGHPNPGTINYLTNQQMGADQLNLLKQCNCVIGVNLMAIMLNHSDIKSITFSDLDKISIQIGFNLIPPGKV